MAQLILPLDHSQAMRRDDFIFASGNARALALVGAFSHWGGRAAAFYGPPASGKTHLARIWAERSGAAVIAAGELHDAPPGAVAVENIDDGIADEGALFALLERGGPLLLTGRQPPTQWRARLPDLN